jgi:hypothetical protein
MLIFKIPNVLTDLVAFAVTCINILQTTEIIQFTSMRVDFNKELSLPFGDYCEVFDGSDNTACSHTAPFIALHPCHTVPFIALHPCNNATSS